MKSFRLTIDEETWRATQKLAERRGESMNGLIQRALRDLTQTYRRREIARRQILAMIGTFGGSLGGLMPSREERNSRR